MFRFSGFIDDEGIGGAQRLREFLKTMPQFKPIDFECVPTTDNFTVSKGRVQATNGGSVTELVWDKLKGQKLIGKGAVKEALRAVGKDPNGSGWVRSSLIKQKLVKAGKTRGELINIAK